ncbi:MAG: hypothetical protein WBO36_13735, partial [Saprospiraceae bacterium]
MFRVLCTLLFLMINILIAVGQTTQPYGSLSNTQSVRDELGIAMKNGVQNAYSLPKRYEGVRGTPFYYDQWSEGVLCLRADSS